MKVLQILTKGHRKNSLSWWSRTSVKPWEDGASLKGLPLPTHTGVWTLARPVCWEETSPYYNEMIAVENSAKQRTVLLKSKNILRTSSACTETTFLIGMSSLWISYPSKKNQCFSETEGFCQGNKLKLLSTPPLTEHRGAPETHGLSSWILDEYPWVQTLFCLSPF